MTADQAAKVHENRLRRMAQRQGFELHKLRRRDERATDYGHVYLRTDGRMIGPFETLDALEQWLLSDPATREGDS
jgi:hypothetical protein